MNLSLGHLPFVAFEVLPDDMRDLSSGNVWTNANEISEEDRRIILKAMDALSKQWHEELDPAKPRVQLNYTMTSTMTSESVITAETTDSILRMRRMPIGLIDPNPYKITVT